MSQPAAASASKFVRKEHKEPSSCPELEDTLGKIQSINSASQISAAITDLTSALSKGIFDINTHSALRDRATILHLTVEQMWKNPDLALAFCDLLRFIIIYKNAKLNLKDFTPEARDVVQETPIEYAIARRKLEVLSALSVVLTEKDPQCQELANIEKAIKSIQNPALETKAEPKTINPTEKSDEKLQQLHHVSDLERSVPTASTKASATSNPWWQDNSPGHDNDECESESGSTPLSKEEVEQKASLNDADSASSTAALRKIGGIAVSKQSTSSSATSSAQTSAVTTLEPQQQRMQPGSL